MHAYNFCCVSLKEDKKLEHRLCVILVGVVTVVRCIMIYTIIIIQLKFIVLQFATLKHTIIRCSHVFQARRHEGTVNDSDSEQAAMIRQYNFQIT